MATMKPLLLLPALLVLSPITRGQLASYHVELSDILDFAVDEKGWLVGRGLSDDLDGPAVGDDSTAIKVVFPLHFKTLDKRRGVGWDARRFGNTLVVLLPESIEAGIVKGFEVATIQLEIPKVSPEFREWDLEITEPLDEGLRWFTARVGPGNFSQKRLDSFYQEGSYLRKIQANRSDVNNMSPDRDRQLCASFLTEEVHFFNDTLDGLQGTLYDQLGYGQVRLPKHVARLWRYLQGVKKYTSPSDRADLFLFNRQLLLGVSDDTPFVGSSKDIVDKSQQNKWSEYGQPLEGLHSRMELVDTKLFPLRAGGFTFRKQGAGGEFLLGRYNFRLATEQEKSEAKDAFVVLDADAAGHWVISKEGKLLSWSTLN